MASDIGKLLVVVGSAKAGTTSLAAWLDQHPLCQLGRQKEPRFFTDFNQRRWQGPGAEQFIATLVSDWDSYLANFPGLGPDTWAIDASTDYIWNGGALERIAEFSKGREVKVVCIIRDPVSRAVSEYNHTLRHGWEDLSFRQSLIAEHSRIRDGFQPLFYHARRSRVHDDIQLAQALFRDDLLILDYAALQDPKTAISQIFDFIGVSNLAIDSEERRNQSFLPRNIIAKRVIESQSIRKIARTLVPKPLRQAAWHSLWKNARSVKTVSPEEVMFFREQLQDEISACIASQNIPTASWTPLSINSEDVLVPDATSRMP